MTSFTTTHSTLTIQLFSFISKCSWSTKGTLRWQLEKSLPMPYRSRTFVLVSFDCPVIKKTQAAPHVCPEPILADFLAINPGLISSLDSLRQFDVGYHVSRSVR